MTDVFVTGIAAVSAAAIGGRQAQASRKEARPVAITSFDASTLPVQAAYQAPSAKPRPYLKRRKSLKLMSRDARLAVLAAGLALEDAGLDPHARDSWPTVPEEVGLYMGVGLEPGDVSEVGPALASVRSKAEAHRVNLPLLGSEGMGLIPPLSALKTLPNMALAHVAINFDLMGPGESLSCWSTAGLHAFAAAVEAIERGECDVALVGAADSDIDFDALTSQIRLGVLTPIRADQTEDLDLWNAGDGWLPGEGSAFLVLESGKHARARGVKPLARVVGHTNFAQLTLAPGKLSADSTRQVLRPLLDARKEPCRIAGAAGHSVAWRSAELEGVQAAAKAAGVGVELVYPSQFYGACGCATALIDVVSMLTGEHTDGDDVVVLAWGPTGEHAAVRLEVMP